MATLDQIVDKQQRQARMMQLTKAERDELESLRKTKRPGALAEMESTIAEQGRELERLRSELDKLRSRPAPSGDGPTLADVDAAIAATSVKLDGKTIGIKIPEDWRVRLEEQMECFRVKTKRQLVMACLLLGLQELERVGVDYGDDDPVEEVPELQRAGGQGDETHRPSSRRAS